jgi:hypothetical protein
MNFYTRYYQIADITIKVESELPFTDTTFLPKFKLFEVDKPGEDVVTVRHYFTLPEIQTIAFGEEVYRKPPWAIFKNDDSWIYTNISQNEKDKNFYRIAIFDHGHTHGQIYNRSQEFFLKGKLNAISLFPTDQILIARMLIDREGCYFHSSGVTLNGSGYLFLGHSEAGKSTMLKMLKPQAVSLCDDRIILRRYPEGFRIFGTWSGGEAENISATSSPLKAICFLNKAQDNHLEQIEDKREILDKLMACLIRPLVTKDWWESILDLMEKVIRDIPCYNLYFDTTGRIAEELVRI